MHYGLNTIPNLNLSGLTASVSSLADLVKQKMASIGLFSGHPDFFCCFFVDISCAGSFITPIWLLEHMQDR